MLQFNKYERLDGDFDLHTAVDAAPETPVVSCVALYRRGWRPGWPALGGTRWIDSDAATVQDARELAWRTAKELAISMALKNNLLRNAEDALSRERLDWENRHDLYGWQGGKGVIWAPKKKLDPHRLFCHGRLIQEMAGMYVGSKDQGIGTRELKWISMATGYTIGLGCRRDTGEGTAAGVLAGLYQAGVESRLLDGASLDVRTLVGERNADALPEDDPLDPRAPRREQQVFEDVPVLVIGAGKVGLPLLRFLHDRGARCYLYDPELKDVDSFYHFIRGRGAAVSARHRALLQDLAKDGRIFSDERRALAHREVQIIVPSGGPTGWLSEPVPDTEDARYDLLCRARADGGSLRLILGAGNDQLPATEGRRQERERALESLAAHDILLVPDPVVSPGGVVAVSQERADHWDAYQVILDAAALVQRSVIALFQVARRNGSDIPDSSRLYAAFEEIARAEAYPSIP